MHHSQLLLLASFLAANVAALPLNINLGAYSPALVVGDGEISFGGKADVSSLMNALEGAAVSGNYFHLSHPLTPSGTLQRHKLISRPGAAANGAANAAPAAASASPVSSLLFLSTFGTDKSSFPGRKRRPSCIPIS
jgi:hypothetical protein